MKKHASGNKETILFAVTGMSPAVLTETVWALAHEKPAIIPDRVVVLTTTRGRDQIVRELLTPNKAFGNQSVWMALRKALERKGVKLLGRLAFGSTSSDIRVFSARDKQATGHELDDIRTRDDNSAVADCILENLRSFVENPDIRVIASIAGGRKTMGTLLYACMTLIGRECDRLTHVLVNDPFDSPALDPRFYFPGQLAAPVGEKRLKSSSAAIDLADIPFVPLRNKFEELSERPGSFTRLVQRYSSEMQNEWEKSVTIRLCPERRHVEIDGRPVTLRSRSFLTLCFLMELNQKGRPVPQMQKDAVEPLRCFLRAQKTDDAGKWLAGSDATTTNDPLVDDLKRELSNLRLSFKKARIPWALGTRSSSLMLGKFVVAKS